MKSSFGNLIGAQRARAAGNAGSSATAAEPVSPSPLAKSSGLPLVSSVFEVPPIGAIGVAPSGGVLSWLNGVYGDQERGEFSYTVPNGKVLLLRAIEYWFYPVYPDSSLSAAIAPLILVNGQRADVFQDAGKLQVVEAKYFKAFAAGAVLTIRVDRLSTLTWAVRYGGLPPPLQSSLQPSFNARLTGQLVAGEGLPVEKSHATRYL